MHLVRGARSERAQTQATIEALEKSTNNNPRAPLRLAFKGNFAPICRAGEAMMSQKYKDVELMLDHYCKMRVFAAPEFVRVAVSEAVQSHMPTGIVVHRVRMRTQTLAAIATKSDMVKVSLPDLASYLLGSGVDKGVRDRIKELFGRLGVVCYKELELDLKNAYDALPILTMSDNVAKSAVKRLVVKMEELFSGKMPDCPITHQPIPRERIRILGCCTAILDADALSKWEGGCPLCRAPIVTVGEIKPEVKPVLEPNDVVAEGKRKAEESGGNAEGKRPLKQVKIERGGSPSLRSTEDCDNDGPCVEPTPSLATDVLETKLAQIDSDVPNSVDGVIKIMKAQVEHEPSSRMLLCFGFEASQRPVVRRIADRIVAELENVCVLDVETCVKDYMKMDQAMLKFNARAKFPGPQVFMINTTNSSSSVQGLDLYQTDLTVIVNNCTMVTQRQAVGRSLRMRPRPAAASSDFRFPAKRIVVASLSL